MKAHILVVDDDPRITNLLRRVLAYEGYSVAIATSGNEALDRALERPPDLVVLDIMLPGMDGLEVARRMRAAGDMVPILMLTARDAIADRVKGRILSIFGGRLLRRQLTDHVYSEVC
jgi:two-component system response regulator MprA